MAAFGPWALLPLVFSSLTAAGLWVVYFVAVADERIVPLWAERWRRNGSFYPPYISVAGNFPPASCIFSEVMNLSAFLGFVIVVLRYLQLKPRIDAAWLNVAGLVLFSVGCFGMTLLGNFQRFSEEVVHNAGTIMAFGLGTAFCWLQSYVTVRVDMAGEGRKAGGVRFLLSGAITLCMVLHFSLMGRGQHMQAARCQWALVMFFLVFIATFAIEFRHSRFGAACRDDCGRPGDLTEAFSNTHRLEPM